MNVNLSNVTNTLRSVWDELVERRMWPLALALVVAIVAVPVLLSKPAEKASPVAPAPAATGAGSPAAAFQPAVSAEGPKSSEIRKNLRRFARKNPFTPQGITLSASSGTAAAAASATSTTGSSTATSTSTGSTTTTGTSGTGTTGTGTSGSTPTTTPAPTTTGTFYYHYTVDVKFGKVGQEDNKTLTEFRALPGSDNPVVVFMGVRNDGETAVFLVSADVSTTGDGKCKPSDTACTFLYLKKGEKQTIEATNVDGTITDYTLKVRDINVKRTTAPTKASASKRSRTIARREARARFNRIENSIQTLGL
jgi:hypothetical protein